MRVPKYDDQLVLKVFQQLHDFELEVSILSVLKAQKSEGFPYLISAKCSETMGEILMTSLGPNLTQLQRACSDKAFSHGTVMKIGIQIIQRLELLHSLGYIHNDIKAENLVVS